MIYKANPLPAFAGHPLAEFGAKLLSYPEITSCAVDAAVFQGVGRSSMQLLHNRRGAKTMRCKIDFLGENNFTRTMQQSGFEALFTGTEPVEIDIGDGFWYRAILLEIGRPSTTGELITTVEYSFQVTRHRGRETTVLVNPSAGTTKTVFWCAGNVAKTDCILTIPVGEFGGDNPYVSLNGLTWELPAQMTDDIILDGVNKRFTMGGRNISAELNWEDFPFLVPGENTLGVVVDSVPVTWGTVSVRYTPTFL